MIELRDLHLAFGARRLLRGVELAVGPAEIVALLGPSGSGKSTLLRIVAGLEQPDRGVVLADGVDITHVPTHRRGIGLMFQDDVLFPHLDVARNVAFGLRMHGVPRNERDARTRELLELVGLGGFERRRTATLSGGEAQRVALARALAPRPRLLLLDEPLGALDRDLHDRLVGDVRALVGQLGLSAIHVTHDRDEAAAIADRVLRLEDGRIVTDAG